MNRLMAITALLMCTAGQLVAQSTVEKNVVYGMHSGLALLMDVYFPAASKERAVVFVPGSAWSRPLGYDAPQLKDAPIAQDFAKALTDAGYTVFALNHRATPRFQYPAPVEDVQRAVRFIRANAARFGIDPQAIGASGASSGGHLVSMVGTLDGEGDPADPDSINRLSSEVQAVVALFTPFDLTKQFQHSVTGGIPEALFLGAWIVPETSPTELEYRRYVVASPITHVTSDDPPFLLIHGDADTAVPIEHSIAMEAALRHAGVEVTFVRVPGGGHGRNFGFAADDPRLPNYLESVVRWFDAHLQ